MPEEIHTVEIDCQTDPRWEAFVTTVPQALIYHHPAWLQVLEEAFGYTPVNLACEDADGRLLGILPLFYTRGLLTGHRYSSLPRTPVAGPLARDDQAATALLRAAVERIRERPHAQLQFKMPSDELDGRVAGMVATPWRMTYQLEMPSQPELLQHTGNARHQAHIRWAVNKAIKHGVQVRLAETERDLRSWYQLYLETMRWFFVPPRPYHFFELAWRRMEPRGMLQLLLAEQYEAGRAKLLAGSVLLKFGQTVFYAFNGRRREDLSFHPNDVIQWQAIQNACADGFRHYDLGEVTHHNRGLAEFKSKWGAEPKWLYRYYYPAPRELEINILESESHLGQLMHAAWQRLPIKATARLSDWAHRHF